MEPRWQGQVPAGAMLVHSPTAIGWIIGRTQTNGKADYDAVHKFQAGLSATPLSQCTRLRCGQPEGRKMWPLMV